MKLDAVKQLLGSYFHQDWVDEFDSEASALQAIVDLEPKDQISAALKEMDEILAGQDSDKKMAETLMDGAGCYFEPASLGLTNRQWLERVRGVLQAGVE